MLLQFRQAVARTAHKTPESLRCRRMARIEVYAARAVLCGEAEAVLQRDARHDGRIEAVEQPPHRRLRSVGLAQVHTVYASVEQLADRLRLAGPEVGPGNDD